MHALNKLTRSNDLTVRALSCGYADTRYVGEYIPNPNAARGAFPYQKRFAVTLTRPSAEYSVNVQDRAAGGRLVGTWHNYLTVSEARAALRRIVRWARFVGETDMPDYDDVPW